MVQIFSQNFEGSTQDVIDWLFYQKKRFVRLNGADLYKGNYNLTYRISKAQTKVEIDASPNAFWGRRWCLFENNKKESPVNEKDKAFYANLKRLLQNDFNIANAFLETAIASNSLTTFSQMSVNKLHVLVEAANVGLDIPDTLVSNDYKEVNKFRLKYNQLITKAISEVGFVEDQDNLYTGYTTIIDSDITEAIGLTLFQELLVKDFEIRAFYIRGQIYSMAIFSQLDKQTTVDFRIYNHDKPNRNTPFRLPKLIEHKMDDLMRKLNLDTGSIDLIKTQDGRFVFLEVNPVGQFGMVSFPCNYYLEEKIASSLHLQ